MATRGRGKRSGGAPSLLLQAVEEACGAALILDAELRVIASTPAAAALLGFAIPVGASAPKLLCGEATHRPVAEALAEGRPVRAVISRPRPGAEDQLIEVRSVPLGDEGEGRGWLLLLESAGAASADGPVEFQKMWTQDPEMKRMFRVIERVADGEVTVLVRGETGSGKELVATAIHALSPRSRGPFRALNCAAFPPNLLESELFGHARGAFTGAVRDTPGHVQLAHGGTLFLDEVAELPLELQAKLLRVLETHTVLPVGARDPVPVDVRVVSATHRALRKEVLAGRFRADLMYRLRVIPVFIPPLRARPGDVMLLASRLIEEFNGRKRRKVERIAPAARRALAAYPFPGNVRELKNVLEYAYAIGDGPILALSDLPPELLAPSHFEGDEPAVQDLERPPSPATAVSPEARRILRAIERSAGSRDRAAQILGISRVTLWRRMKQLGLLHEEEPAT